MCFDLIVKVEHLFSEQNTKKVAIAGLGGLLIGNIIPLHDISSIMSASSIRASEMLIQIIQSNINMESIMSKSMVAGISQQLIHHETGKRKERNRWEIIRDLLTVAQEEVKARKTRIMQKACLDWRNFQRYFDFLIEEDFIKENNNPHKGNYVITEKGKILLKRLKEVDEMLH